MLRDYYAVLGLPQGSPLAKIRVAYRSLAASYHPDKFSAASADELAAATLRMVELNEAMSVLGNVEKRSAYDRELKALTLSVARTKRRPPPNSPQPPRQPAVEPCAAPPTQEPATRRPGAEKRIAALRAQIQKVPLAWKNLTSTAWTWSLESNGTGRPLFIAHLHADVLESKNVQLLDKAIDRVLAERKEKLRSPWIVILLSFKKLADSTKILSALDTIVKRSRGWLKKRPMIVLFDEGSGRVVRVGDIPEHDQMDRILNLLLHP